MRKYLVQLVGPISGVKIHAFVLTMRAVYCLYAVILGACVGQPCLLVYCLVILFVLVAIIREGLRLSKRQWRYAVSH